MSNKDKKDIKQKNENIFSDNNGQMNEKNIKEEEENQTRDEIDQKESLEDQISEGGGEQNNKEEEKSTEENLQDEIHQLRDEKLRLLAEMENLRKRANKERIDSIRYGSINLARDILSPDDNLTRALEAIPQEEKNSENIKNLIYGLKIVQKEFSNILEKHGVQKIKALNMKFDHNFHQAMIEIENDEVEEGTVIKEMQSGYTMYERLLRPSMVGVAKKSTNNSDDKKNDDKNN